MGWEQHLMFVVDSTLRCGSYCDSLCVESVRVIRRLYRWALLTVVAVAVVVVVVAVAVLPERLYSDADNQMMIIVKDFWSPSEKTASLLNYTRYSVWILSASRSRWLLREDGNHTFVYVTNEKENKHVAKKSYSPSLKPNASPRTPTATITDRVGY